MCAEGHGEPCGADSVVGELAVGELWPVNAGALFCANDTRARLTHGPQLSATVNLNSNAFISEMYANFEKSSVEL